MELVYYAHDFLLKHNLLCKIMINKSNILTVADYGSMEVLQSFLQESVVMKNFDHPNVLHILGVGLDPDNGLPFIVLPFMANGNLQLYLKSKRSKLTNVNQLPEVIITVHITYLLVCSYAILCIHNCEQFVI